MNNVLIWQWNANGLKGVKRDLFLQQLATQNPHVVLLSETHWNVKDAEYISKQLKSYNLLYANRPDGYGGVAILIKRNIGFSNVCSRNLNHNIQIISIVSHNLFNRNVSISSVYCPDGSAYGLEDVHEVFGNPTGSAIVGGDFNAHHRQWTSRHNENPSGKGLADFLGESPNWILLTPKDTETRQCPSTGIGFTIDLTFSTPDIGFPENLRAGAHWGSDHLPVFVSFASSQTSRPLPRVWTFRKSKWESWNDDVKHNLLAANFTHTSDPALAYEIFTDALRTASQRHFTPRLNVAVQKEKPRPWWTPDCSRAVAVCRRAYTAWLRFPSASNKYLLNKAEAQKKRTFRSAQRQSWEKTLNDINLSRNPKQVWGFVKSLLGAKKSNFQKWTDIPTSPSVLQTEKKKVLADVFVTHFTEHADQPLDDDALSASLLAKVDEAIRDERSHLNEAITEDELARAIAAGRSNALGPDQMHQEMLSNLNAANRAHLLHLLNVLLKNGFCPADWKSANIIPLLKSNKDSREVNSFRPISITSPLAKCFERILKARLSWHLDHYNLLPKCQAGFRKGCSTQDNIWDLENAVKIGFNNNKETHCIFLDLKKAYDLVWIPGLLFKLSKARINGPILLWLKNFLVDRQVRVVLDDTSSNVKYVSVGVPQGAVLSPLLFTVMTSDFPFARSQQNQLGVVLRMFADDIALHVTHSNRGKAKASLDTALERVSKWCKTWKFQVSGSKSFLISFSRRRVNTEPLQLRVNEETIPSVDQGKFLGIIFDKKLSWIPQILDLLSKMARKLNVFKVLVKRNMDLKPFLLINLYKSLIRSTIDYHYTAILQSKSCLTMKLDAMQNTVIRSVLMTPQSTPRAHLWLDSGLAPVHCRAEWLACQYLIKLQFKPNNPFYENAKNTWSAITEWKSRSTPNVAICKTVLAALGIELFRNQEPVEEFVKPPWLMPTISTIQFPMSKKLAVEKPTEAKAMFRALYEQTDDAISTLNVFTDGSHDANSDETACAIYRPDKKLGRAWRLSDGASVFSAELFAIFKAIETNAQEDVDLIRIFSDSLSAVRAVNAFLPANDLIIRIRNAAVNASSSGTKLVLYWIPSHVGIQENEIVDKLANEARSNPDCETVPGTAPRQRTAIAFNRVWSEKLVKYLSNLHGFFARAPRSAHTPEP